MGILNGTDIYWHSKDTYNKQDKEMRFHGTDQTDEYDVDYDYDILDSHL